jgi:hypothetical protein
MPPLVCTGAGRGDDVWLFGLTVAMGAILGLPQFTFYSDLLMGHIKSLAQEFALRKALIWH